MRAGSVRPAGCWHLFGLPEHSRVWDLHQRRDPKEQAFVKRRADGRIVRMAPTEIAGELVRRRAEEQPTQLMCSLCANPATRHSNNNALRLGTKPRCETHKGLHHLPLPCFHCGNPATGAGARRARSRGTRAYCEEHKHGGGLGIAGDGHRGGGHPTKRMPCAECGGPATAQSSANARFRGHQAYCKEHCRMGRGGRKRVSWVFS